MKRLILALLAAAAALLPARATAQTSAFRYDARRIPVGIVFEYRKSALDGSNASDISVYVRDRTHVESFKQWHDPTTRATLVMAQMDWKRWSVGGFQAFELNCGKPPEPRATLETGAGEFRISLMAEPVPMQHVPWHSYDFDFTSLSLVMTMLRDPQGSFTFWRSDFEFEPTMRFGEMGEVTMTFQGHETRDSVKTRRYSIGGPGLRNTSGTWWASAATGTLVEFEIPIGDEPGYDNVRLKLLGSRRLSAEQWESHKRSALCQATH